MIKYLALSIILYSLVASVAGYFWVSPSFSLSSLIGGLTILVNLLTLAFFWSRVFEKKSIALSLILIIFKYLILGLVLWSFASIRGLSPIGFCVGMGSLIFALMASLIFNRYAKKNI